MREETETENEGWWSPTSFGGYICSACGRYSPTAPPTCPHCGASMQMQELDDFYRDSDGLPRW